jgi:HEAT repeat protein
MRSLLIGAAALALLSGCPDNPYDADTWIDKLDNPKEFDRAVTELEHLCNPKAIEALGKAWEKNNKPTRTLQVMIDLARPLTTEEAATKFCTDYEKSGRPANWDKALPFLRIAVEDFESQSQRSIDGAVKAAEAIGESQLPEGVQILIDAVNRKMQPKDNGQRVRLTAIAALGKYKDKAAIQTLANVIRADVSSQPPQIVGAAINTIGEMRAPESVPILLEAMYRVPLFFQQIRRALVSSGEGAKGELRKILKHEHGDINALFKEKKLDKYCGDDGKAPPSDCQEVSAMDYYAAIVLGDLYDREAVDGLIDALKRPQKPAYFSDWNAGPPAHNAILDALRKIGDPKSAQAVLNVWADPKGDERLRPVAATVYGFVSTTGSEKYGADSGLGLLGKIAGDNAADQGLRLAAAESYGRLADDKGKIAVLKAQAKKYADASQKARGEADGAPKKALDEANKKFEAAKNELTTAQQEVEKAKAAAGGDVTKVPDDVLTKATKAKENFEKVKKEVYLPAKEKFDTFDGQAQGYKGYQRGFENHIARIEIAIHCKGNAECLVGAFDAKPDEVFERLKKGDYIDVRKDADWTEDDRKELVVAQIERAVVELRRMGEKARPQLPKLLEKAASPDRLIRQVILLSLARIAPLPCTECETKLDEAIKAGQGKQELSDLNYETQLVRNYFSWAGKSGAEKSP